MMLHDSGFAWDNSPSVPSGDSTPQDAATAPTPSLKRHAACDECRSRKLKCSGEVNGCSRCVKQSLICHYSVQKQMGRPPKKRAREDDGLIQGDPESSQFGSLGADASAVSDSYGYCAPVYAAPFSAPQTAPQLLSTDNNHNHSWQLDHGKLDPVPATTSPWPDFSSVSAAASNPFSMPPGLAEMHSPPMSPDSNSSDPKCTCLSYLYLCLSHLSSLAPFPVSQHTFCSLFIAARTGRAVIQCQACPTKFATGVQNVMFTGTLLNVIGDAWLRVSQADPVELGKQAAPCNYVSAVNQTSPNPAETWKDWLRQTVRSAVIGGPHDGAGAVQCSDAPSLLTLIKEMEARQRRWHQKHPLSPAQSEGSTPEQSAQSHDQSDEQDFLCLRVAKSAREIIKKFDFEPHEYPDGVVS